MYVYLALFIVAIVYLLYKVYPKKHPSKQFANISPGGFSIHDFRTSSSTTPKKILRVVQLNIEKAKQLDNIIRTLQQLNPDILLYKK